MKRFDKVLLCFIVSVIFIFSSFGLVLSQTITLSRGEDLPSTGAIHQFLVADIGVTSAAGRNKIFKITFGAGNTIGDKLQVTITKNGTEVANGTTDPLTENFAGETIYNYEVADRAGGMSGMGEVDKSIQAQVMATGAFPEGTYVIKVGLVNAGTSDTLTIPIAAPFLQAINPVDKAVNQAALDFRWRSNLKDLRLHIFEDPMGRVEITRGAGTSAGGLPRNVTGQAWDGSSIASLLKDGERYYWQLTGYMETTHGRVKASGPLSEFGFFVGTPTSDTTFGFDENEMININSELIAILRKLVNPQAADSLLRYKLKRVVMEGRYVGYDDVISILSCINDEGVKVNAVFFR